MASDVNNSARHCMFLLAFFVIVDMAAAKSMAARKMQLSFPPIGVDKPISPSADIKTCPSAQRIKFLLEKMEKLKSTPYFINPQSVHSDDANLNHLFSDDASDEIIDSINATFKEHNYSITKLLNDFYDLKYGKGIDSDDALFDVAFDYFKDITTENGCDIDQCPFVQRQYMDRGGRRRDDEHKEDEGDDLLIDTLSTIYCYFLRSYDTTRFTKEERERIMKMTDSKSWKSVTDAIDGDDGKNQIDDDNDSEDEKESTKSDLVMSMVTEILNSKKRRGRSRYRDVDEDEKDAQKLVDFTAISEAVGVDEAVLREDLKDYVNDRDQLIAGLLDVVYGDDADDATIWNKLKSKRNISETAP